MHLSHRYPIRIRNLSPPHPDLMVAGTPRSATSVSGNYLVSALSVGQSVSRHGTTTRGRLPVVRPSAHHEGPRTSTAGLLQVRPNVLRSFSRRPLTLPGPGRRSGAGHNDLGRSAFWAEPDVDPGGFGCDHCFGARCVEDPAAQTSCTNTRAGADPFCSGPADPRRRACRGCRRGAVAGPAV